jgi:hypothetical protein
MDDGLNDVDFDEQGELPDNIWSMDDGLNDVVPDEQGELPDNIWSMDDGLNDVVPDERPVLLVHGEGNGRTGRVRLTLLPRLAHLPDIFCNL